MPTAVEEALKKAIKSNPLSRLGLEDDDHNEISTPIPPPDKKELKEEKKDEPDNKNIKGRDEQIKDLRTKRDEALKELEKAKAELAELQGLKPLKKVADYVKAKKKKDVLEDEDVDDFIEVGKARKKQLVDLETRYKEKEQAVKEFEIEASDEWRNDYKAKIVKDGDLLKTTIINFDDAGKPRAPQATQKFLQTITDRKADGSILTPHEIKIEFTRFKKAFEDESGVDYESPGISELIKSAETYHNSVERAIKAKQNWSKETERIKKERLFNEAKQQEQEQIKEREGRDYLIKKAKSTEAVKKVAEVFDTDEVKFETLINSEHDFMQKILAGDGDAKPRGYDNLIISMAKGQAFDKLAERYRTVEKENEELKAKLNSGLPISGKRRTDDNNNNEKPKEIKFDPKVSPLSRMGLEE